MFLKIYEKLGNIGKAHLCIDPEAKPKVMPCRKIPLALQEKVQTQLTELVNRGILTPVSDPTEWVSQMAVVEKKPSGKLRICIDPQALNKALLREHYKLPTLDDILPKLNKAKIFSKVDVKEAFWHVELDEKSSELTTMITPFGRYRWCRLPYGLKVSSEIFQKRLIENIEDLPGIACIADDIIIAGCGENVQEAKKNLDENTEKLKLRCQERHIRLNKQKTVLRKAKEDGRDQFLALLELRNTPRQDSNKSPAELCFGQNTRSLIPKIIKPKKEEIEVNNKRKNSVVTGCVISSLVGVPIYVYDVTVHMIL